MYLYAERMELLGYGISDSTAYASAYDSDFFQSLCLGSTAERAYEIVETFTFIQVVCISLTFHYFATSSRI